MGENWGASKEKTWAIGGFAKRCFGCNPCLLSFWDFFGLRLQCHFAALISFGLAGLIIIVEGKMGQTQEAED